MPGTPAPGMVSRERLIALLEQELAEPRPFETVAGDLPDLLDGDLRLGEALAALAEADRKRFWVKAQPLWFSRFGWRLIRPMMATGLLAAVLFYLLGTTGEFLFFLLGVAALYVVLQVYAHVWTRRDETKLMEAERELDARLREILDGLRSAPGR